MTNYIDGFIFPIPRKHLDQYKAVAQEVAQIWREYGALSYNEFIGEDLSFPGTRSFAEVLELQNEEVVIFGWVDFPSKSVRDEANQKVPNDSRMTKLVAPLIDPKRLIFNAQRMVYGGFESFIQSP